MRRRRITATLAAALILWALSCTGMADEPHPSDLAAAWLIEVDGKRVASYRADETLPPASLTKLMTAVLVIEKMTLHPADDLLIVSPTAAQARGSKINLRANESYRPQDLLTAMIVASANDACVALAEWHAGSEARFVIQMNHRAREMGLKKTRFINACGHDAVGHVASASELAALARQAMSLPDYARRAHIETATIRSQAPKKRAIRFSNKNRLIGRLSGAIGVKSGYTAGAGPCLVAMAVRDDRQALLVLLNAKNRWWDAHAALDYALSHAPVPAR